MGMRTRRIVAGLLLSGIAAAAWADDVKRLGILYAGSGNEKASVENVLVEMLKQRGYVEGRNLVVTRRYAEGDYPRLASYARELEAQKPDVVVTMCTPSTRAMSQATSEIPIVMAMIADPVGDKLVESLARPGRNVTGTSSQTTELLPKMLETFATALPKSARVAVLANSANPVHVRLWQVAERSAGPLNLRLRRYDVENRQAIPSVLEAIARDRMDALFVLPDDPMLRAEQARIIATATRNRILSLYSTREFVQAGGFMSLGESFADGYRQAAIYVDRILHGSKPGTLPVSQPTKFELSVNLKTATEVGATVPELLLLRAETIVE